MCENHSDDEGSDNDSDNPRLEYCLIGNEGSDMDEDYMEMPHDFISNQDITQEEVDDLRSRAGRLSVPSLNDYVRRRDMMG